MKKIIGSLLLLAILTGCGSDKEAEEQTAVTDYELTSEDKELVQDTLDKLDETKGMAVEVNPTLDLEVATTKLLDAGYTPFDYGDGEVVEGVYSIGEVLNFDGLSAFVDLSLPTGPTFSIVMVIPDSSNPENYTYYNIEFDGNLECNAGTQDVAGAQLIDCKDVYSYVSANDQEFKTTLDTLLTVLEITADLAGGNAETVQQRIGG